MNNVEGYSYCIQIERNFETNEQTYHVEGSLLPCRNSESLRDTTSTFTAIHCSERLIQLLEIGLGEREAACGVLREVADVGHALVRLLPQSTTEFIEQFQCSSSSK